MFIQGGYIHSVHCVRGHNRNIYSKIVPSHFMIIINFTISIISSIEYSYNSFRHEGWINCWYDRGFRIIITVRAAFATIERRNTTSLPVSDTIPSPKSDIPASEPFISKGTVEHTSNCEFLLKIYHFPSIWKSLSWTKLAATLSSIYALTTSDRGIKNPTKKQVVTEGDKIRVNWSTRQLPRFLFIRTTRLKSAQKLRTS